MPCSNRWHRYKLTGCWNKWHALCSTTDLWQLGMFSCRRHRQLAWVEPRQTSLRRCNFPPTVLSGCESLVQTGLKRENNNKQSKTWAKRAKIGRGGGQRSCLKSLMLQLVWFPKVANLSFNQKWLNSDWMCMRWLCQRVDGGGETTSWFYPNHSLLLSQQTKQDFLWQPLTKSDILKTK